MGKKWNKIQWAFLGASFGILCLFMALRFDHVLDSDMASELILANLMNQEHQWIMTDSWYYPSELRVFSFQLVMAPLFSLFSDWHTVRVVGSIICYGVFLASYYYFCSQVGLKSLFPVTAGFLLLPFCAEYFAVFLYGLFYLPHMVLDFLLIGLILGLRKECRRGPLIWKTAAVGLLSFLGGLGGQRLLVILSAPLVFASFLLAFLHRKEEDGTKRTAALSVYSAFGTLAGFLVNQLIFARDYSFRSYEFIRPAFPNLARIRRIFLGWLRSLGLWTKGSVNSGDWPTSGQIAPASVPFQLLVCLILGLLILAAILYYLKERQSAPLESQFLSAFLLCGGVVMTGLFLTTNMEFAVRYVLPVTVFAIPVTALFLKELPLAKKRKGLLSGITIGITCLSCLMVYQKFWKADLTAEYRQIVQKLTENGYFEGYSTFWNGNVLTELSDGKIDMRVWSDAERSRNLENMDDVFVWLQLAEHSVTHPEGSCFVLLTQKENETYVIAEKMSEDHIFYESEEYVIYGYGSYEELKEDLDETA